jgi:hypothetical protein
VAVRQTRDGLYVLRTLTKGKSVPMGYIRVQLSREPRARGEPDTWWKIMTLDDYRNLQPRLVSRTLLDENLKEKNV